MPSAQIQLFHLIIELLLSRHTKSPWSKVLFPNHRKRCFEARSPEDFHRLFGRDQLKISNPLGTHFPENVIEAPGRIPFIHRNPELDSAHLGDIGFEGVSRFRQPNALRMTEFEDGTFPLWPFRISIEFSRCGGIVLSFWHLNVKSHEILIHDLGRIRLSTMYPISLSTGHCREGGTFATIVRRRHQARDLRIVYSKP
jgi:hypothetical protein